jgi:predicted RND superfamily exporter protein
MGFIQRRLVKIVMRAVLFPRTTLAICGILLVAAGLFAWFNLKLSTNQDELLTPDLKFFRDYRHFTNKFPENESFVVILEPKEYVHAPPARRWIEYADKIEAALVALKDDVRRVNTHTPLQELGVQGLLFAEWPEVREQSAQVKDFRQLVGILAEPPGLDAIVLGTNKTARFYNALSRGPAADSEALALVVTRSLANALARPPEEWQHGRDVPNFVEADPLAGRDPSRFGYNMVPNELKRGTPAYEKEKILAINIYTNRDYSSLADVTEPLERMRAAVKSVAAGFPEFREPVITGRPALEADEMRTSDHDTRIAEICGLSLVFVVLYLFLRNLWMVVVAEVCLVVGIAWTFGWATLSIGRLNLLSLVFVIALIGIGMDYLIQILTRYRFEKKRYTRPTAVWARVFRYVSAPISTACAGAAGAFLVSRLTSFSGAGELGIIAGGGLLLCLATGYTILPALLTLFPAKVGKVPVSRRYKLRGRHPRAGGIRLLPAVLWILVALGGLYLAFPPSFDASLLKLQAEGLESVREVRKLRAWSAVVLADNLPALRDARTALTAPRDDGQPTTILSTESLLDAIDKQQWLAQTNANFLNVNWQEPPPPRVADLHAIADAADRMITEWSRQPNAGDRASLREAVTALRRALDDGTAADDMKLARLNAWQHAFMAELRTNLTQFAPPPLDEARLPEDLKNHLVSYRDNAGKPADKPTYALYLYPREDLWDNAKLRDFVVEIERKFGHFQAAHPQPNVVLTGIAPQLFHSTEEIHRAFLNSTLYALALIVLLVLLDLRSLPQTLLAISVLALGLPMLLLCMWIWRHVFHEPFGIPGSWNFANFFALPILIGAGHEYGVFMVHRYRETLADPRRVWRVWDVSDRALLLCGIVTSSSFGFLIAAKHHGLASLGWVMCVGTACIYLATILVLRPVLQWRIKHKGVYYAVSPPASLVPAPATPPARPVAASPAPAPSDGQAQHPAPKSRQESHSARGVP